MSNYKEMTIVDAADILDALITELYEESQMAEGAEIITELANKVDALIWAMANLKEHPVYKASPVVQEREAGKYAGLSNCD